MARENASAPPLKALIVEKINKKRSEEFHSQLQTEFKIVLEEVADEFLLNLEGDEKSKYINICKRYEPITNKDIISDNGEKGKEPTVFVTSDGHKYQF